MQPSQQQLASAAAGPQLTPPRTVGAAVRQARDALRRYRADTAPARAQPAAAPQQPPPPQQQPSRLVVHLPLPVASDAVPGVPAMEQGFCLFDESEWPGGIVQRFRALRPLVDATLEGYDPQFLGMLEDPADGVGCWAIQGSGADMTLVGLVTNATFASFVKLAQGGYGSRPLNPGHTLVAVNPEWTQARDIGQPWERKLKADAQALLGDTPWEVLYDCRLVRSSRGRGHGLLVGSWGRGWHLWAAGEDASSSSVRDACLLWSPTKPQQSEVVAAVNAAAQAAAAAKPKRGGLAGLLDSMR